MLAPVRRGLDPPLPCRFNFLELPYESFACAVPLPCWEFTPLLSIWAQLIDPFLFQLRRSTWRHVCMYLESYQDAVCKSPFEGATIKRRRCWCFKVFCFKVWRRYVVRYVKSIIFWPTSMRGQQTSRRNFVSTKNYRFCIEDFWNATLTLSLSACLCSCTCRFGSVPGVWFKWGRRRTLMFVRNSVFDGFRHFHTIYILIDCNNRKWTYSYYT